MGEQSKRWTVEFQNGQWTPAVVANPWLPTTKNYFVADAAAKRANHLKLKWTEWTRVFDMFGEMDARVRESANEEESGAEAATVAASPDTTSYRVAAPKDEPAILALFKKVAPEIPIRLADPKVEERMKIEIAQCRGSTWVAVDESGKVVGFALTRPDLRAKDSATALKYIGVHGDARGLRICSNLISKLKAKGLPLTASVLSGNKSGMAERFVKFGFTKVGSDDAETKFRWDPPKTG